MAKATRPVRKIWVTRRPEIVAALRADGRECYLATSLLGLYMQSRAKVFFCTVNSRDFCFSSLTPRSTIFQLWHGLPLKKIGFDVTSRPWLKRIVDVVRASLTDKYSYVLSPAPEFDDIMQSAFRVGKERVIRSLYPRCDGLFQAGLHTEDIRSAFNVVTPKLLFYLPTHRKEGRDPAAINALIRSIKLLAPKLEDLGITLIVKPHFYDRDNVVDEKCGNVIITRDLPVDLYRSLSSSDGLITDYSSISLDYSAVGRPIFYFVPDIVEYISQDRESYFDLTTIMPGAAISIVSLSVQIELCFKAGVPPEKIGINVSEKLYEEPISDYFQRLSERLIYDK